MTSPRPQSTDQQSRATDALGREWISRVRAGDARAFEQMYRAYKNDLAAFVNSYVRSPQATEEILQDLFLRIWQQRDMWECTGPLGAYLFRAARNRAISHIRHERLDAAFRERTANEYLAAAMPGGVAGPDESIGTGDLERAIERALDELPPRCREAFVLNRRHHLSYAEVASVMQLSVKTVEVQMGRALAILRRELAEWRTP